MGKATSKRFSCMGRDGVALENELVRAVVEDEGGMMPEFGVRRGRGLQNAHWIPEFRWRGGRTWDEARDAPELGLRLLSIIAGDFPCSPNFGTGGEVDGASLPLHGWAANERWALDGTGVDGESGAAFARWSLRSPAPTMPLSWEKLNLVLPGEPAYYSAITVRNGGSAPTSVNLVRHNTLGPPFLQAGCRVSVSAERFESIPVGTDYDAGRRLEGGVEFASLAEAPLIGGGTADLREIPGMIGLTDFVTGAIPARLPLGWSCVVNPVLRLGYLCFFPGLAGLPEGEIAPSFNDLWMQFGGRAFTPWARHEGGLDTTFCLGTENGTARFGAGLAGSRAQPELLGRETVVTLPAGGARTLWYGTALLPLDAALLAEGISAVEPERGALVLRGERSHQRVALSGDLAGPRIIGARLLPR